MFGNYNKLAGAIIGTLVGNAVAFAFVWLAFKGIATCEVPDNVETCVVNFMGFPLTQAKIAAAVVGVINAFMVWKFKPNVPPSS